MRVCLTVQGEQPISSATSAMFSGVPSAGAVAPGTASGSRRNGPGCPGQCPGQHWPGCGAEKGRKRAGLVESACRAFGSVAALFLMLEFGNLMSMAAFVVLAGTSEQSSQKSFEEMRKVQVQIPDECQHQRRCEELPLEFWTRCHRVDEGQKEGERQREEQQTGDRREKSKERGQPNRNSWMRRREFARAALTADLRGARIGMPARTEFEIVGSPAEVTEERLSGSNSMAVVAIAHGFYRSDCV